MTHPDVESLQSPRRPSLSSRLRRTLHFPINDDDYLTQLWMNDKWMVRVFAIILLLHTVYVNVVYAVIYDTSPYRNGAMYGFLYPISVAILAMSFGRPLRSPTIRVLWYSLLSIAGVMMTIQISMKSILCRYHVENAEACGPTGRPLTELQWVYAIAGPMLMLSVMRNSWPAQAIAVIVMLVFLIISIVSELPRTNANPFIAWSQIGIAIAANTLALTVAAKRDERDKELFIQNQMNTRLQAHLREEMDERALAQRKAADEETKRTQFTSYIFHEIRNPLNTIILSMELLDVDDGFKGNMSETVDENFTRIKTALTSIESIINDTLDLRKMNEGKLSLNPKPFDFHRMIRTSVWTMESTWLEKHISLDLKLDERISQLPCVIGDETRLHQVLTNYLSNAVKFTPIGGAITLRTYLESNPDSDRAVITVTVSDTGIGISEDNQKKLFQAYVQIDPDTNQGGKGTGLGLSICAGIINSMSGKYGVTSSPGQGASFYFTVAFTLSDISPTPAASVSPSTVSSRKSMSDPAPTSAFPEEDRAFKLAILVTDDDPMQRRIMTQLLTRIGHTVDTAIDGVNCLEKVALARANNEPYDVIFIDNQMPRLSGGDTISVLRAAGVETHIVSLTATADAELHETLKERGATEILVKPSSKALIEKTLKMLPFPLKLPR